MVAECFEKIRVNPGNFVDGRKRFDEKVYDDDSQFKQEQEHIQEVQSLDMIGECMQLDIARAVPHETSTEPGSAAVFPSLVYQSCLNETVSPFKATASCINYSSLQFHMTDCQA